MCIAYELPKRFVGDLAPNSLYDTVMVFQEWQPSVPSEVPSNGSRGKDSSNSESSRKTPSVEISSDAGKTNRKSRKPEECLETQVSILCLIYAESIITPSCLITKKFAGLHFVLTCVLI